MAALFVVAMLWTGVLPATGASAQAVETTDIAGRTVSLPAPAERIVIGSSLNLEALALAHPNPVGLIAGWSGMTNVMDESLASSIRERYAGVDSIPNVGRFGPDTLSVETVIGLSPDLVIFNLYDLANGGDAATDPQIRRLEAAGIPVAVVDFFREPLTNSAPSLRVLGDLLGTRDRVDAFLAFYDRHKDAVATRLAEAGDTLEPPRVFMHVHAAQADCCFTPGRGVLDDFIRFAGGDNIGAAILPGATGRVSLEQILSQGIDVYIATGGYAHGSQSGFTMGPGVSEKVARAGLQRLLQRPGLAALKPVREGRAYGLWHDFAHSPLHIVALEMMAKWLHPERFADLDPARTLAEINARFTAAPLEGTFGTRAR